MGPSPAFCFPPPPVLNPAYPPRCLRARGGNSPLFSAVLTQRTPPPPPAPVAMRVEDTETGDYGLSKQREDAKRRGCPVPRDVWREPKKNDHPSPRTYSRCNGL